jgi:hypothetical protein
MNKETLFWALVTLSALAALGFLLGQSDGQPLYNSADERHAVADECIGQHATDPDDWVHYHAVVEISILDEFIEIPDNIGRPEGDCGMRALHTHDTSGKIHIEMYDPVDAPLAAFFDIWGVHMDSTGFDEYRVDADHEFIMFVTENGNRLQVDDFEDHILKDGQTIELIYRAVE